MKPSLRLNLSLDILPRQPPGGEDKIKSFFKGFSIYLFMYVFVSDIFLKRRFWNPQKVVVER